MSSNAPVTDIVPKAWPTSVTDGPPDQELWNTLQTDKERYNKLKLFKVPGYEDILLFDCYERSVQLSQYFASFHAALGVFKHRIPKDDSPLSRVMAAFSQAVDQGLRAFWEAMNADALRLLKDGRYAPINVALAVPRRKDTAGKRPLDDPEDEAPLDDSENNVPKPAVPQVEGGEEDDFVLVFIGFVNVLCNHYPRLSEVGPKVGVSWSQVLGSVIEAGQAFYDEYTGKKKDATLRPSSTPAPHGYLPGPKVDTKPGGKQTHRGNGANPGGDSKL